MSFILWIIFGGLVGWVASLIMKTDAQQGIILNIVVGIIGSVIGNWLMSQFGASNGSYSVYGFLVALLGAVILIWIVKLLRK